MDTAVFIIIAIVVFIGGFIILPQFMLRRAVKQVIRMLRDVGATRPTTAKTLEELGIKMNRSMMSFGFRDYKRYAIPALIRAGVVVETEEGKVYLEESKLLPTFK
jgi:hypothetical protein